MIKYLFFVIFLSLFFLMNYYTYKRFLSKISFLQPYKGFVRAAIYIALLFIILFISARYYDIFSQKLLYLFSYSIGILFMLFVMALIYDLLQTGAQKVPFDEGRRRFIKIAFDVTFLILTFSYILKGIYNGFKEPILKRQKIKIKNFNRDGFKIIQLSDVHIGNTIKKDFVEKLVERVNATKPDLIVLTGDLVDLDIHKITEDIQPLQELSSKHGVYFILGNHEYFHNTHEIIEHIKRLGIKVLINEAKVIDQSFNLVGLSDAVGDRMGFLPPDLPKAFEPIDPALPTIVLAHQPKMIKSLETYKPDLVLSGHTHGGQIFPFGLLVLLDQPYLSGLYQHDAHTQIFVSKGAGYWGPPIRIHADSEIVALEIKST